MSVATTELPDPPEGTRDATTADQLRSGGWVALALGTRLFSTRTTTGQWLTSFVILAIAIGGAVSAAQAVTAGSIVSLIVLMAIASAILLTGAVLSRRRRRDATRHYVLDDGTAILSITARQGTWHLAGHGRAAGAAGAGERLRAILLPELVAVADAQDVAIAARAAAPKLATTYQAELPGLFDVGPAWPYGRRLYRRRRSEREALSAELHREDEPFHA